MRSKLRWMLAVVVAVDIFIGAAFLMGGYTPTLAKTEMETEPTAGELDPAEREAATRDALRMLGEELARRTQELEKREAEVAEILRGSEVLRRAGLDIGGGAAPTSTSAEESTRSAPETVNEDFKRLQRAYENMEPESAALALVELAGRDQEAVVELLLGWKPRTSGSILDAITQLNSGLAADLSYEIWKRRGNSEPQAATSGR